MHFSKQLVCQRRSSVSLPSNTLDIVVLALVCANWARDFSNFGFCKHSGSQASIIEQLAIVTSTLTWLTLVPPAFFNGFLEGWPSVFFVYHYFFFFFNVSIRKRVYGDYYMWPHDPKWDVNVPGWYQVLFGLGVMAGHWFAAFEGPELHLTLGGWSNVGIWVLIMTALFMQFTLHCT